MISLTLLPARPLQSVVERVPTKGEVEARDCAPSERSSPAGRVLWPRVGGGGGGGQTGGTRAVVEEESSAYIRLVKFLVRERTWSGPERGRSAASL